MKYSLASNTWDEREIQAIQKVIDSGRYTMGPCVEKFEHEFCEYFKTPYAVMVNSGSTANLLMLTLLKEKYKLKGNIIVPAVSWSTTYFPVYQNNFKLNFVDVDPFTLNIDPSKIYDAINEDTCAILAVNLLGNPCYFSSLKKIAEEKNLMLIEDNCESLGAIYQDQYTGTIGDLGSYSFFFSHHLQTMEGGMIACKTKDDYDFLRSLRAHGWCRDLPINNNLYQKTGDPFKDSFTFITPGYSVRPLEMSGAVGSVQLNKWPEMREQRVKNAEHFIGTFENLTGVNTQKEIEQSSWFGFSMVFSEGLLGKRDQIVEAFKKEGVESRPIVAGNFMRNPVIEYLDCISNNDYSVANHIHENGLFIGNDIRDLRKEIDEVFNIVKGVRNAKKR